MKRSVESGMGIKQGKSGLRESGSVQGTGLRAERKMRNRTGRTDVTLDRMKTP